jgi:aryl-alcohol dehydrogenase-like predicted oxidoreductase
MKYRPLGTSGLQVSSLCLGTMTFGEANEDSFMHRVGCPEPTAFEIMDRALAAGVNFIDTADVYGQDGLTERIVGRWFNHAKKRDEVILATKFRFRMKDGPNGSGASRYRIVRTVEESLRRLQTDRIDLYQVHMQDADTPEEETLRALDDLVRQGKVLYLGASNYAAYRLTESVLTSKHKNLERFVSLQALYNLVSRELEREHVPACLRHGLGIIPWSPLAGGFLSGKYKSGDGMSGAPEGSRFATWAKAGKKMDTPRNWEILEAVEKVAAAHHASVAQVSLAWLLHKPAVASVIFGARNLSQLEDNLKACEIELNDTEIRALDDASRIELGYPYDMMRRVQNRW